MKTLVGVGLLALGLGVLSLFVPIPRSERQGLKVGGVSVGIETSHDERVPSIVSAVLILGGAGLALAGRVKRT